MLTDSVVIRYSIGARENPFQFKTLARIQSTFGATKRTEKNVPLVPGEGEPSLNQNGVFYRPASLLDRLGATNGAVQVSEL